MLQNMRDNLKGIGIVIVVIISIPFVLTGAEQFFTGGNKAPQVTEVNGVAITSDELARETHQLARQMGFQGSLEQMNDSLKGFVQQQALSSLTLRAVVQGAAEESGMTVANETLKQHIREIPAFQRDGAFDREVYLNVLAQNGYDSQSFTVGLERDLLGNQFTQGVLTSEFITDGELAQSVAVAEQLRDFYYLTVPVAPLLETVEIDDQALQARYDESRDQLVVPEQVVVEYIELTRDALTSGLEVDEAEIRQRFEEELAEARQNSQQQRRLAHILISDSGDRQPQDVAAEIKAKLDAGEDFAELAKAHSQDGGTANLGGDLGFIEPSVLPDALAEAATALELNVVSEPIKSDSGYHLLKVTDIQQAALPSFEEQQQRISDDIKAELAEQQYATVLEKLKGAAYDTFGEDSLQKVADELGVQMQLSEPFSRSGGNGIAGEQAVVTAAFSKEVFDDSYSSDVQELSDRRAVVVKLHEKIPERTKALEEVRDELIADLKQEKAKEQIKIRGEALLARIVAGETVEAVAKAEQLQWQVSLDTKRAGGNVDTTARSKAFSLPAPTADNPQIAGLVSGSGDYLVVQLTSVEYPTVDKLPQAQRQSMLASLKQSAARRSMDAYRKRLLEQAEIN